MQKLSEVANPIGGMSVGRQVGRELLNGEWQANGGVAQQNRNCTNLGDNKSD